MKAFSNFSLALLSLLYTSITTAFPFSPPVNAANAIANRLNSINVTDTSILTKELTAFPPGPPDRKLYHTIPNTDVAIIFTTLGLIPHRNETLVGQVLREALYTSLDRRITAKMPGHGFKTQEGNFLLSVNHSVGASDLTWGMWTAVLISMIDYAKAYAGWDFQFEIELVEETQLSGIIIAAGFAMTRGQGTGRR